MIAKIVSGLLKAFPLLALVSCANTHGGNDTVKATPKYLQYANDPVQNLYVIGFVGFTINEKCNFLETIQKATFEQEVTEASSFFEVYLNTKDIVSSKSEFHSYMEQLIKGSARGADKLFPACDENAKSAVVLGQSALRDFNSSFKKQLK
jgi:hypothetical protein